MVGALLGTGLGECSGIVDAGREDIVWWMRLDETRWMHAGVEQLGRGRLIVWSSEINGIAGLALWDGGCSADGEGRIRERLSCGLSVFDGEERN